MRKNEMDEDVKERTSWDGKWGVYADKFVKGKRAIAWGIWTIWKHAKELKKVYDNEKDANDYLAV